MRALVTGGAGGIGRGIVTRLLDRGYAITVADTQPVHSDADVRGLIVDVASEAGAREAVTTAAGDEGLHVLVNCIGVSPKQNGRQRALQDIDLDEWEHVFRVNVTSCFLTIREAWSRLVDDDNASVVNVVSVVAKLGSVGPEGTMFGLVHPSGAHYCASKAALANLTLSAARGLAVRGIRCNGVAPGYIGSGMQGATDPALEKMILRQLPMGRAGTTAEVAAVVDFLVSPAASYLTGEIVDVDGGWVPD